MYLNPWHLTSKPKGYMQLLRTALRHLETDAFQCDSQDVPPYRNSKSVALVPATNFRWNDNMATELSAVGKLRRLKKKNLCFSFCQKEIIHLDSLTLLYSGSFHRYCCILHLKEMRAVLLFNDAPFAFLRMSTTTFVCHLRGQKIVWITDLESWLIAEPAC